MAGMGDRKILIAVLGLLIGLAMTSTVVTVHSVRRIDDQIVNEEDFPNNSLTTATALHNNVNQTAQEAFAYIISGNTVERDEAHQVMAEFSRLIAAYQGLGHYTAVDHEQGEFSTVIESHRSFAALTEKLFADFEADGSVDSDLFDEYEATIDGLATSIVVHMSADEIDVATAQAQAVRAEEQARDSLLRVGLSISGLSILAAAFTFGVYRRLASARREAERDLNLHMQALEATNVGVVMVSATEPDLPIIYANPGFERITGYAKDQVVGRNCRLLQGELTDQDALAALREAIAAEQPTGVIIENYTAGGTSFWNELSVSPVRDESGQVTHFVGVMNDATERIRLESLVRQTGKMNAVGQLAGGIAHDFNNYLMAINAAVWVIQNGTNPDVDHWMEQIAAAGSRSAALTEQLMTFAKTKQVSIDVIDLDETITSLRPLLRSTIAESVDISVELEPGEPHLVLSDRSQLDQVVTNLVLNARDAVGDSGRITINTSVTTLSEVDVAGHGNAAPGTYVRLAVSDTGTGIAPEIADSLFDPFVTTKPPGAGGGLGLAIVYGVVTNAGGLTRVDSEFGRGATVEAYFPLAEFDLTRKPSPRCPEVAVDIDRSVLLVEDDEATRASINAMLDSLGFEVVTAENGCRALELLGSRPDVGLVISDVTMPEMGGVELADRARRIRSDLKILFVSGYTQNALEGRESSEMLLTKPFTVEDLKMKLAEPFPTQPA